MVDFTVFSESVMGWKHEKNNGVNEDACGVFDGRDFKIIAVADGHGACECFRSHIGSRMAVESALEILMSFKKSVDEFHLLVNLHKYDQRDELVRFLIHDLIELWNARVLEHVGQFPISSEEYNLAPSLSMVYQRGKYLTNIYGSTLLCAILSEDFLLVLQQGDGCCVVLDEDGHILHPMPLDDICVRNMTTSLCDRDASKRMRYVYYDLSRVKFGGIFLASDGVENSFGDEVFLDAFFAELCRELSGLDVSVVSSYVRGLLGEISERGSRDDVSLAGIFSRDFLCDKKGVLDLYVRLAKKMFALNDAKKVCLQNQRQKDFLDCEFERSEAGLKEVEQSLNELLERQVGLFRKREWLAGEFSRVVHACEVSKAGLKVCQDEFDGLKELLDGKK